MLWLRFLPKPLRSFCKHWCEFILFIKSKTLPVSKFLLKFEKRIYIYCKSRILDIVVLVRYINIFCDIIYLLV